ncbi:MAG TPA: type II toxin-antitoxin system Phd/YefM family antitoxin [Candidatus Acidoferrales bacterium]|nr:type II toxin-antitoxin system Phd/YefM family antitoxin [Candidatus Acidoferrales bacterium]
MYTVHQAKTNLSRLISEACEGGDVVIARGKQPVARLVPLAGNRKKRLPGRLKGRIRVPKAFFKPVSRAELARWGIG